MTDLRQAAQQALEFLSHDMVAEDWPHQKRKDAVCDALRAALAEPRPIQECYGDCPTDPATCLNPCNFEGRPKPEQKPQTTHWEGCEAVHPECKTEQEPDGISWLKRDSGYFTAPTPRRPLTDEEMRECAQSMNAEPLAEGWPELIKFARAIERAHGIGEQT